MAHVPPIISPYKCAHCSAYLRFLLVADLCTVHDLDHDIQAVLLQKPSHVLTTYTV